MFSWLNVQVLITYILYNPVQITHMSDVVEVKHIL